MGRLSPFEVTHVLLMSPNELLCIKHYCSVRWILCSLLRPHMSCAPRHLFELETRARSPITNEPANKPCYCVAGVNSAGHFPELNAFQMARMAAETLWLLCCERVKLSLALIYSWGAVHEHKQKGYITTYNGVQIAMTNQLFNHSGHFVHFGKALL